MIGELVRLVRRRLADGSELADLRDQVIAQTERAERLLDDNVAAVRRLLQVEADLAFMVDRHDREPSVEWDRFGQTWRELARYDRTVAPTAEQVDAACGQWRRWLHDLYDIDTGEPLQVYLLMAGVSLAHEVACRMTPGGLCPHTQISNLTTAMTLARFVPEQVRPQ